MGNLMKYNKALSFIALILLVLTYQNCAENLSPQHRGLSSASNSDNTPLIITSQSPASGTYNIARGQKLTLSITLNKVTTLPVTWMKDDKEIFSSLSATDTQHYLEIISFSDQDIGRYTAKINNGQNISQPIFLNLMPNAVEPLNIINQSTNDINLNLNSQIAKTVFVKTDRTTKNNLSITWYQNGNPIESSNDLNHTILPRLGSVGKYHVIIKDTVTGQLATSKSINVSAEFSKQMRLCTARRLQLRINKEPMNNNNSHQLKVLVAGMDILGSIGAECPFEFRSYLPVYSEFINTNSSHNFRLKVTTNVSVECKGLKLDVPSINYNTMDRSKNYLYKNTCGGGDRNFYPVVSFKIEAHQN